METRRSSDLPALVWDYSFPLLSNRFFLWDMSKVFVISGLVMAILLTVILIAVGNTHAIGPFLLLTGALLIVLMLITILVCLVWFGNRFHALFAVNAEGAMVEIARSRDRIMNRLAVVLGVLRGSMSATGAGLLAVSEEAKSIVWSEVRSVRYYPDERVISIKNSWRVVVRLYCTPENYTQVVAAVRSYAGRQG